MASGICGGESCKATSSTDPCCDRTLRNIGQQIRHVEFRCCPRNLQVIRSNVASVVQCSKTVIALLNLQLALEQDLVMNINLNDMKVNATEHEKLCN